MSDAREILAELVKWHQAPEPSNSSAGAAHAVGLRAAWERAYAYLAAEQATVPPREPTLAHAIAIADTIRLRYAHDYEEKRPDWQGNVYWAKVEAAAHIVRTLEHAAAIEGKRP